MTASSEGATRELDRLSALNDNLALALIEMVHTYWHNDRDKIEQPPACINTANDAIADWAWHFHGRPK